VEGKFGSPVVVQAGSSTETSAVIGGGFEYAFFPRWSVKIEYLHIFEGATFVYAAAFCAAAGCQIKNEDGDLVRLGINVTEGTPRSAPHLETKNPADNPLGGPDQPVTTTSGRRRRTSISTSSRHGFSLLATAARLKLNATSGSGSLRLARACDSQSRSRS
jgi:hypothetical protein